MRDGGGEMKNFGEIFKKFRDESSIMKLATLP